MKISAINLENEDYLIHPFRQIDANRILQLIRDVFEIYSDKDCMKYVPEKIMDSIEQAQFFITRAVIHNHYGVSITEFITKKDENKAIGLLQLISPNIIQKEYPDIEKDVWMLEYYLNKKYWGENIMTHAVNAVLRNVFEQGISCVGALVNRENIASIKLLKINGFRLIMEYDKLQDLYELRI